MPVDVLTAFTSAARITTENGVKLNVGDYNELTLFLDITVVSGTTPTLDIKVQGFDTLGSKWVDLGYAFAQKTTVSTDVLKLDNTKPFGKRIRAVATIAGTTPSFTFSLSAHGKRKR